MKNWVRCMYDSRPSLFAGAAAMIRSMIILFLFRIKFQTLLLQIHEQEDQEPSTEERVYIDELTGTLLDFDGTHLTISSNGGETYVFDVS